MSNSEVSRLYEQIINDVINESRQDFEDSGIDEATLQDLRNIWRDNLAQTKVANFSWVEDASEAPESIDGSSAVIDPLENLVSGTKTEIKKEGDIDSIDNSTSEAPNNSSSNFQLEINDSSGDITKSLQKQRENELKKERTLASLDSDDINSDLDDSDDDGQGSDDEGEDGEGMIILCLYEKVLRVKNKWKCNLKDGIANINGKDFSFAKASGESEW
ncbi:hypothetical protein WICMUC_005896 [Wickerhamomyces mucosus]|uniref:Transcription initiation factor IIA large subunit n=1 Tax=Wickerhamomyces mucosus TaxID=1378264 RepID=A0A9P8T3K7_9ASCO|nr:hypothetical protein WICMUC_005896 [Wickerhamomyces mucosus]